ncbi:MAG: lipoate--protein ligase family protein [Thermoleophilia bacterium]|nr:lipoate--protein ligase family protein [Thermoleophilia bacterium]
MSDTPSRRTGSAYIEVGATLLAAAVAGQAGLVATIVSPPALVLGSAQSEADAATEMEVVRRGTGGGAVLCDEGVLLIDLAVPAGHALSPENVTEAYRPLGEAVHHALVGLGVDCRTVGVAEARAMDDARKAAARRACWAGLSPYEVVLGDGRKLVGLAQRRRRGAVLHQVAIPVTTSPLAVLDHLVDGAALEPWLRETAMVASAGGCGSATPAGVWDILREPLTVLICT